MNQEINKICELCKSIVERLSNENWDSYDAGALFDISKMIYGQNDSDVKKLRKLLENINNGV